MPTQDDLMSFLASAARHSPLDQERLLQSIREEVERTAQEAVEEQPVQQQEEPEHTEERGVNEEVMRYAMQNLGLDNPEGEPDENEEEEDEEEEEKEVESVAPQEVVENFIRPVQQEEESVQDDTPENEKPIQLPTYSTVREELVRFSDAEWFNKVQEKVIVLAGVGGIGSNMAVILAKLNPNAIYIFDNDVVEPFNLAGQFYSDDDIGKPKVEALAASVTKYTNYSSIFALNRMYNPGEEIVADIMVCGFDNMRARKNYFSAWKSHVLSLSEERRKDCLFIDGRLTADEFQIFCMTGMDDFYMDDYANNYLFSDYEAQRVTCSYKQTGFLADMIGAFMVNLVVNFCANQVNPKRNMTLPFMTSYRSSMMFLDFKR